MTGHPDDLLEAYAFGDCADASVAAHVDSCGQCAARVSTAASAAAWLSASHFEAPPAGLRSRVLTAARSVRAPSVSSALDAYAAQVASFGTLLDGLSAPDWQAPVFDGRTVAELVSHLARNDAQVSADLGFASAPQPSARREWRTQSDRLLRTVGSRADLLGHPVRLAGRVPLRRPLRDALTQRAFETWIHDSDVRAAVDLPPVSPSPVHLARIVTFGLALLPGAMDAAGRGRPGVAVTVRLTGPGGGTFTVSLSAATPAPGGPSAGPAPGGSAVEPGPGGPAGAAASDGSAVADVRLPAERFGRLLAGRIPVPQAAAEITGDRRAALDMLTVAATLGCE